MYQIPDGVKGNSKIKYQTLFTKTDYQTLTQKMMMMVMAITMMTTTMVIMVLPAGGHRHLGDSEGLAQFLLPATTL